MQALEAAIAFAITMLVLAIVVTTIVETLHRTIGLREKGLALMLGGFYDRILASRSAGVPPTAEDRQAFIDMMTVNRSPVGHAPMTSRRRRLHADSRSEDRKFLSWIWSGRRLGSLSLTSFMERLGGSDYGARLVAQATAAGATGVEWMLADVAQKFEAFGHDASEFFESRARLLSVIVGLVLAFATNVNAITLFETFMQRPDVTRAVIAQGQQVSDRYDALQSRVSTSGASAAQVQQAADEARAAVKDLRSAGVPIGWNAQSLADYRSSRWTAVLGLALGGLLIGLGAPFWYTTLQMVTGERARTAGTATPAEGTAPAAPQGIPNTPLEAFHAAFGARLSTDGIAPAEEAVG